jgi:hypothetical protein
MNGGDDDDDDDDKDAGPECRRCGCFDLPVYYTRRRGNKILRRRVCAHCGQPMTTLERDIAAGASGSAPPKKSSTNGTTSDIPRGIEAPSRNGARSDP